MPIVDVEVVGADLGVLPDASVIAHAIGTALQSEPGHTWVRLRTLPATQYGENDAVAPTPGPVFVRVLVARLPTGAALDAAVDALTRAVALLLGRPLERVHVEYAPPGAGRVAFGGRVVR